MLRKTICTLLILIAVATANAQYYYTSELNNWQLINYHHSNKSGLAAVIDSFALENKIYQIEKNSLQVSGRKNSYSTEHITFDKMGRSMIQIRTSDSGYKKKINWLLQRSFNQAGLMNWNSYSTNSNYGYQQFYEFNDSNKVISINNFNHKYQFSGKTQINYNEKGKQSIIIRSNKKKILHSYKYYYYPDGQIKQIVLYGRKGKILSVTDYACDETGKTSRKMKDTARVCTVKTYLPDGSIVTTTQSFNYNGKPYKRVEIRNSIDQLLRYDLYMGIKEELYYSNIITYQNGIKIRSEYKNQSRKHHHYSKITTFDNEGRITKDETVEMRRSKKNIFSFDYEYNEKGMVTKEKSLKNGKPQSETVYKYSYY